MLCSIMLKGAGFIYRSPQHLWRLTDSRAAWAKLRSSAARTASSPRHPLLGSLLRTGATVKSLKSLDMFVAKAKEPQGEVLNASAMCSVRSRVVGGPTSV